MPELRPEQLAAVNQTYNYWRSAASDRKFLWNAKPRFGKTLAAYHFAQKISAQRILIITNRPSIADSWANDFRDFIAPESDFIFASARKITARPPAYDSSSSHSAPSTTARFYSRAELLRNSELLKRPLIFFISLQDIKGHETNSSSFKNKNRWIFEVDKPWDLLIIDEGHEGIKTDKTAKLFSRIKTNFTLYLSGTPFRALADQDFQDEQIYNWTYLDEQLAKKSGSKLHADLPVLDFYLATPQLAIAPQSGTENLNELSEFFRITNHHFAHEELVKIWLDRLATFFKKQTATNFSHSFWLMSGVAECNAMAKMLRTHPYFQNYQIISAAGVQSTSAKPNGTHPAEAKQTSSPSSLLTKIRHAIGTDPSKTHTITLSCGRLTTGITVPEWSAVLMLYSSADLERVSSAQYLQAAFRAQNPCDKFDKPTSFVLDFAPERALTILQDYAENLCASDELFQYLDIHYLSKGSWQLLSATEIQTLLRQIIAQEIVDGGFITSNKLFNISNVIKNPSPMLSILRERKPSHDRQKKPLIDLQNLADFDGVDVKTQSRLRRNAENLYREKLRGLARTIPVLLHAYGDEHTTLSNLTEQIPSAEFQQITGIRKVDFISLVNSGYFNETNFNLAAKEFLRREKLLANYFSNDQLETIYIPPQRGDQVFTPPELVVQMVDRLEAENPKLFQNPKTTFFDPSSRSGLFLAEITRRLFRYLRPTFQSDHDCLQHIISQQIYAWSSNESMLQSTLNAILSFARFKTIDFSPSELKTLKRNFIKFDPRTDQGFDLAQIEKIVHNKWGMSMRFDVIIGNPPYQYGRRQVYADFYRLAVDLNPELLCMIFPIGWQKVYNHNGLGQLNNARYKRDPHIVSLDFYSETGPDKLFPNQNTGGVNIILRNRQHDNRGKIQKLESGRPAGTTVLPLTNSEIVKPAELTVLLPLVEFAPKMESLGSARKPYGFHADPLRNPAKYNLKLSEKAKSPEDIRLFGLLPSGTRGFRYIRRSQLPKTTACLDSHKLFVPKAWGNMSARIGLGGSYANICVAKPGDACAETFIEFGPFANQKEAIRMAKYFMTKFFRALLFLAKDTQNTAKDKYKYIPVPDLSGQIWDQQIADLDDYLFDKYQVPGDSRQFIKEHIQPRDETNIEIL